MPLRSASLAIAVAAVCATAAAAEAPLPLRATAMLYGYFRAGSTVPDAEALGGAAGSTNFPLVLDREVLRESISLIALPGEAVSFEPTVAGFRVILANTTSQVLAFQASDSTLSIVREARDIDGTWKAIESLPWSFCGNSYHRVFLPPNHYWAFVAPVYDGPIATDMRFVLYRGEDPPVYSNQFPGRVSPGQFLPPPDPYAEIPTKPAAI